MNDRAPNGDDARISDKMDAMVEAAPAGTQLIVITNSDGQSSIRTVGTVLKHEAAAAAGMTIVACVSMMVTLLHHTEGISRGQAEGMVAEWGLAAIERGLIIEPDRSRMRSTEMGPDDG